MRLPRYQQQGTGVGRASRSLTAGVQTSGLGNQISKGISNVANKFLDYQIKMQVAERDAKVKLKTAEAGSQITNKLLEFQDPRNTNYLNPSSWENEYSNYETQVIDNAKQEFGNDAKYILPSLISKLTEGRIKTKEIVFNQILKNQKNAYETERSAYIDGIANYTRPQEFTANFEIHKNNMESYRKNGLHGDTEFEEQIKKDKYQTSYKYIEFQAIANSTVVSPTGQNNIDWSGTLRRLKDTKNKFFDIDGNELSVDDDLRQKLIADIGEKAKTQKALFTDELGMQQLNNIKPLRRDLIEIQAKTPKGMEIQKNFLTDLSSGKYGKLSDQQIKGAASLYRTIIKEDADKSDTPAGVLANTILSVLVNSGAVDTVAEQNVIHLAAEQGLLKLERYDKLNKKSEANMKEIAKENAMYYKRAIGMVAKELGQKDPTSVFRNLGPDASMDQLLQAFDDNYDEETFKAVLYIDQILEYGEKKGISIKEMLTLKNDMNPNGMIEDLTKYVRSIKKENFAKQTFSNFQLPTDFTLDDAYTFSAENWFKGKKPTLPQMPPKKENEGIVEYLLRIKGKLPTDGLSINRGINIVDNLETNAFVLPLIQEQE
tara:strand:- start:9630 stop:11432 length:1803 start_codon:yes stop_codon:yes gene_type:complete